ncbi:MAG: bifunctional phosphopantothenoylcysteine decarboxylase/phosphopantothenate--cysteine ligase CoaBC [Nitrospinae bacterium CG11_big_fil_rev_8_21_14_0_20_56_8]|nr:MAG: bifunctional phosphopantothenoylcysteine decarboxylase/phosphopantothenate--cysteine ligase CoaBC [Nitrospinae bacterium CG11_big_fil_rev_8_21_14_0_20_56_8]
MTSSLKGKKIVLGVSGGIACYKAVELLRLLVKEGARVFVVMSRNAKKFVTPLTFEALSRNPVYHKVFDSADSASMEHIRAAEAADLLVVAPATAGTLGKMAHGLTDDALSTLFVAFRGPVLVAPAMNDGMYDNPAVRANIETMQSRGIGFIDPEVGSLACGVVGLGRLAEPEKILAAVRDRLARAWDLAGRQFLITAGPTREFLDPVRYISNPSSGKMGYAVAEAARDRGAQVTLISGPTPLKPPPGMRVFACKTAQEMRTLVLDHLASTEILVMTAAVGDFAPEQVQKEKIKKQGDEPIQIRLLPTPDILREVAKSKTGQFVVGFAAETENLVESAREKLLKKDLDMIVANDVSAPGIGFQSDTNQVTFLDRSGTVEQLPLLSKREIAHRLLDRIAAKLSSNPQTGS